MAPAWLTRGYRYLHITCTLVRIYISWGRRRLRYLSKSLYGLGSAWQLSASAFKWSGNCQLPYPSSNATNQLLSVYFIHLALPFYSHWKNQIRSSEISPELSLWIWSSTMATILYEPSGCNCDGLSQAHRPSNDSESNQTLGKVYSKVDINTAATKALELAAEGQTLG